MPKQELFFEEQAGSRRVEVLKCYDRSYAHAAFKNMDERALKQLWEALKLEETYDVTDVPRLNDPDDVTGEAASFLWDELLEQAREDGNLLSFFVVNEAVNGRVQSLYVSPDWPSARSFAEEHTGGAFPKAVRTF